MTKTRLIRKLTGISTAICVAITGIASVAAAPAPLDSVVYSVRDLSSENLSIIETTQADIENEQWNINALGGVSPELYKDFPVIISKSVSKRAQLDLTIEYLKIVNSGDYAVFSIKETNTDKVFCEQNFAEKSKLELKNVPMNKLYTVTLTECINGTEKIYCGTLETIYRRAEMPSNVYVGEENGLNDILADSVNIMEIPSEDDTVIEDENGNMYIIPAEQNSEVISVEPSQFESIYNALDNNKIYSVESGAVVEGEYNHFRGFVSKKSEFKNLGIFMPAFNFNVIDDAMVQPRALSFNNEVSVASAHPMASASEITNAYSYTQMQDEVFSLPRNGKTYLPIKFTFPETGSYTIEVVTTAQMSAEYWSINNGVPSYSRVITGTETSITQSISVVAGQQRAWVIHLEDGVSSGSAVFRIRYTSVTDDYENSVYALAQNTNNKISCNTNISGQIDYMGDVDSFYLNTDISGEYGIQVNNNSSSAIRIYVYRKVTPTSNPLYVYDNQINANRGITYMPTISDTSEHYFVSIYAMDTSNYGNDYTLQIISPTKGDQYEPNNSFATAYELPYTSGTEHMMNDLTLHKGDIDYFKFTTGAYGSDLYLWLNMVNFIQYNMSLYKGNVSNPTFVTSAETEWIELEDLEPSTTYYVCIDNVGLGANAYSAVMSTSFAWQITNLTAQPSATLSGDVAHTYSKDNTITSISDLTNAVMAKLTCYQRSFEIPDATAINDVALFYMNGSTETLLTAEAVNSLAAGSYPITVKYSGVAATGGTVTLTITPATEPEGEVVELENITIDIATNIKWDWAACARMIANNRLIREGSSTTTKSIGNAILAIQGSSGINERGTLLETASAADYFYTNGTTETYNFYESTIDVNTAENTLLGLLNNGQAVAMILTSNTSPSDMSLARYVVLCGINTANHTYKIADPHLNTISWVSEEVLFNGGYNGNNDLRFTGGVVEFL